MGVDRRTAVAARPRSDGKLRVHSATVGETATVDGDPGGDWADYLAGVRWALRDVGHAVGGADLAVASDVPVGAGLSSSAALETRPAPLGDCGVVVLDTGVRHDLADSAYADRVATCERGVDLLAARLDRVDALRDVSVEAIERVAADLPEPVRARCRHVVTENDRVRAARRALDRGSPARAGELMDASHRSLRDDYAVSCRELDAAAAAGRATDGVLGSRLTGAGFGGCTVHLVAGDPAQVADTLAAAYRERVGAEPDVYPCAPSPGAYAPSVSST